MANFGEKYTFPDEIQTEPVDEVEVIIEDDRPEEDQQNATPLPKNIVEEIDKDDLESYSKEAKQRLLQMKKLINDERREKEQALREQQEAIRVAQAIINENKDLKGRLSNGEKVYLDTAKENVNREIDEAKRAYKEAYDSGDSERLVEAQEKLTEVKLKSNQISNYRPQYDENTLQNQQNQVQIPQQQPQPQRLDSKTQAWLDKNKWYGADDDMSFLALSVHKRLEREGVPTGSDHYWNSIDTEIRKRFPEKFEENAEIKDSARRSTVVAPATRSTSPKRIKLTNTQMALVKKLKVSPEQYYSEILKLEN